MKRDFRKLADETFDLLVIGGGVYGAWTAYDAALRGLRVALVERSDWASGTSSASSKLIHGGLRYLEQLHLGLVRTSLDERKRLATLAPHQVRPLRFVIPVYRGDRVGRFRLKIGLSLYDLLAGGDQPVDRHRSLSRDELLRSSGFLRHEGLRGGFNYGDCWTDDARYTVEIICGALEAGVVAVNRAEALRLLIEEGRVLGAEARDRESGSTAEIRAALTFNAAGPWSAALLPEDREAPPLTRLTKGAHLVMPGLPVDDAFLLTARSDGRVFFLIPWYGRTLLGTTDTGYKDNPDALRLEAADVRYLLTEANRVLEGSPWSEADILGSYVGLRTLQNQPDTAPSTITREWCLEQPLPGLLMPIGGKYTSARADSGEAVDRAIELLGRPAIPSPTADRPFPWRPAGPFLPWLEQAVREGVALGLDPGTARCAGYRFGTRIEKLHRILAERPELAARIHPELTFCRAEIVHAVESEMARTLEDVLRRRIPLILLARPDESWLSGAADLIGERLGWSADRRGEEVRALIGAARLPGATDREAPR